MTQIYVVGSEKGGTGKTTLSTNLATLLAVQGHDVLLVDTDKQGSASIWSATRNDAAFPTNITCISKMGNSTGLEIAKLKGKFDYIVVDAGGRDSVELRSAMVIADHVLIPVRPSQFDVWTLTTMEQLVNDARARGNYNLKATVCINLASPNPALKDETQDVLSILPEFSDAFSPSQIIIHDRVAFRRAARDGCAVIELTEGDNTKAITEIQSLYQELFQ